MRVLHLAILAVIVLLGISIIVVSSLSEDESPSIPDAQYSLYPVYLAPNESGWVDLTTLHHGYTYAPGGCWLVTVVIHNSSSEYIEFDRHHMVMTYLDASNKTRSTSVNICYDKYPIGPGETVTFDTVAIQYQGTEVSFHLESDVINYIRK